MQGHDAPGGEQNAGVAPAPALIRAARADPPGLPVNGYRFRASRLVRVQDGLHHAPPARVRRHRREPGASADCSTIVASS